jgi:hypothetical protein
MERNYLYEISQDLVFYIKSFFSNLTRINYLFFGPNKLFFKNSIGYRKSKMAFARSLIIAVLMGQTAIAAATASERKTFPEPVTVGRQRYAGQHATKDASMTGATPLDRVAIAVDGAESSHGKDSGMWRPDPSGPQGPMQVSEAAANDVGGGDRLDLVQNRAIGRAYLAQLYGRYRNWPDAIAAYNWGLGKMDAWVKAGRPGDRFLVGVAIYLRRVLHDSGLCNGAEPRHLQSAGIADRSAGREVMPDISTHSLCARIYSSRSSKDLYKTDIGSEPPRSLFEREATSARSSWLVAMRNSFGCIAASGRSLQCR